MRAQLQEGGRYCNAIRQAEFELLCYNFLTYYIIRVMTFVIFKRLHWLLKNHFFYNIYSTIFIPFDKGQVSSVTRIQLPIQTRITIFPVNCWADEFFLSDETKSKFERVFIIIYLFQRNSIIIILYSPIYNFYNI